VREAPLQRRDTLSRRARVAREKRQATERISVMGNINRQARMSKKKNRDLVLTQMFTQTARLFFLGIIFVAVIVIAALVFTLTS
jgi:hypothetical protein